MQLIPNLTLGQYQAAGKHIASYVAGGVTFAVAWHFLSPTQGTELTDGINAISSGVAQIAKGVAGIAGVVVPIYTAWRAAKNASPASQGTSLVATANNAANPEQAKVAQVAIASAVIESKDLLLKGTIAAPADVAQAVPSQKVVPQ